MWTSMLISTLITLTFVALPGCGHDRATRDDHEAQPALSNLGGRTCRMEVHRRWVRPRDGAGPQLPSDALAEADYRPAADGPIHEVRFSADNASVEVSGMAGDLVAASDEHREYNLDRGTMTGGRLVVRSNTALAAELTRYGSGLPVIGSERGPLSCDEASRR